MQTAAETVQGSLGGLTGLQSGGGLGRGVTLLHPIRRRVGKYLQHNCIHPLGFYVAPRSLTGTLFFPC